MVLNPGSSSRLESMIYAGKSSAQMLTRARILLKADVSEAGEGWSDSAISAALDTSVNNVARTRQQLVEEGFEATLSRKYNPNSARPRIFDGAAEAKLIALGLLARSRGVRSLEPASPRRQSRRIDIVEQRQRQYDRTDAEKNVLKPHRNRQWVIPPKPTAGSSPPWKTCWKPTEAARSRSSSRVFGRDLQAIDRRDAGHDPAEARSTRPSRLRI